MRRNAYVTLIPLLACLSFSCSASNEKQAINDLLESRTVAAELALEIEDTAEDPFGYLGEISTDQEGFIYVTDTQLRTIRVYNQKGDLLQIIGRDGRGPGEFLSLRNLIVDPDDKTIWVYDINQFQITEVISHSGTEWEPAAQYSIEIESGYPIQAHRIDNRLIVFSMSTLRDLSPQQVRISLQSAGLEGEDVYEILSYTESEMVMEETGEEFVPFHPIPFSWVTHGIIDRSNRIYIGKSDSLRVKIYDFEGHMLQEIKNEIRYKPITAKDIEGYGASSSDPNYQLIPDHHPAFVDLIIDDLGRPWFNLGSFEDSIDTWVGLDNSGALVSSINLPSRLNVQEIQRYTIYGIHQNETGEQSIHIYRLAN